MRGVGNPMFGVKRPNQEGENNPACRPDVREKISKALKGKKKPYMIERNKLNIGKSYEEIYGKDRANEIKNKMSISRIGKQKGKIVSIETKNKMSEGKSKHIYTITSPENCIVETHSLKSFCRENNVNRNWLQKACKENTPYRRWSVTRILKDGKV